MPRPARVKKEDVIEACAQLASQGQKITTRNVIEIVGGSFRTISPIVREYKALAGIPEAIEDIQDENNNGAISVAEPEETATVAQEEIPETAIETDPLQKMSEEAIKKADFEAAQQTLAVQYIIATQDYQTPGLKEQVSQGLEEIYKRAHAQRMANLFPKGIRDKLRNPKT